MTPLQDLLQFKSVRNSYVTFIYLTTERNSFTKHMSMLLFCSVHNYLKVLYFLSNMEYTLLFPVYIINQNPIFFNLSIVYIPDLYKHIRKRVQLQLG